MGEENRRITKKMKVEDIHRLLHPRRDTKDMPAPLRDELLAEMEVEGEVDAAKKSREG
jgi:hypothetical protein